MQINEHRMGPQSLADLLLYDSLIDDGILLQQDGSLWPLGPFEVLTSDQRLTQKWRS